MSGNVPLRSPTPPAMANNAASRFRTSRSMPSWVNEINDRVGPPPPLPPANADPEYEVIDVANQQYSNAPPPIPLKSLDIKRMTVMKCDLCGSVSPAVRCEQCDQNLFCASCDDRYHRHPKRQTHTRTPVELQTTAVKPPLPPKGEAGTSGPLPPPRRNKRPGSFHFPSPMLGRKQDQDQTIPTTVPQSLAGNQLQKPPQAPPSPALSLRDKMNSLKRFIHPSNRPLPDPPEQKIGSSNSSLDTISKRSTSVGPNKSVSSTMEKIQNNTAATLDRMTLLQQRYRQHQETMKSDGDRSRRASLSSNADLQSSVQNIRTKPPSVPSTLHHQQQQFHQQHHALQSRWIEPPTPRIRSGSVASGINLLPSASSTVPNESNPSSNNPPFMSSTQRPDFGTSPDSGPPNPRSTSVFNLNQMHQQQPNMWGFTPLQQAQSMAQMNFNQMHWNQMNPWMAGQSQNGSNMSLNIPSSQQGHYPHDQSGCPPGWNNAWGGMYPYPMGMLPMMPGMAMPPPRSRAHSRSRAASPALSIKSRKSTMSMRNLNRSSYINDLTDDEDSDEEFAKSRGRRDRRQRVDSNSSLDFEEPDNSFVRASSVKHSRFNRDRRGGSSARSLIDYPVSQKRDSHRSKYDREELLRERFDKMSLSSPRKVASDSFTNDSDGESNRRGSNKSRSNNESFSSPRKITSDSMTNDSDAEFERRRLAKQKASSNVSSPRRIASDSFTNDSDAEFERRKQQKLKVAGTTVTSAKRMESDSMTGDSDAIRERTKSIGSRRQSESDKPKSVKPKAVKSTPKKIPSDSLTPDTDGDHKRRFTTRKTVKKNSSTEFIATNSDVEFERRKEDKRKNSSAFNGSPQIQTPKKSDDEEKVVHMKTVEIKNHINESKSEIVDFVLEDTPPPAAPIAAPDCEWECEFCTYVNEAGVKICAICCKTAKVAVGTAKADDDSSRSPPPDVVQEPPFEKRKVQSPVTEVKKPQMTPHPAKEVETKKKDNDLEEEIDGDGDVFEESEKCDENCVEENQYENHVMHRKTSAQMKPECPKDNGEIDQNLDSEVAKVVKVVKEKVSTGCGPSPPREINREMEPTRLQDSNQLSTSRASIGTSPPPQDMSTQTYDTFEKVHEDNSSAGQVLTQDKLINNLAQPQSGSIYQRSYSLATPQLLQVGTSRPTSRQSFSSDTQSLPPTPHELSPQPQDLQAQAQQNDHQETSPHQDETMSYLDRAINQIIQTATAKTNFSASRPLDQNKYRAMTDLRRIDVVRPTHSTSGNSNTQQKRQTADNNMSERSEDATKMMESLNIAQQDNSAGAELANLLKEAERYKFTAEELQAALSHCKDKHPVQWLRDNWSKLIDTVQTLATKYGHEKRENTIGTISSIEAREALRLHKANIWHAITECIEQRQKKYNEIASKGNFTREDIVTSLTAHHGNLELAMLELSKTQLKPFLMRIWGPPNGADNDSGNLLLQQALKEDRSGISSEIQEFISAHVEKELLSDATTSDVEVVSSTEVKLEECQETTNHSETNGNGEVVAEESIPSNTMILRDIEKLIDQMEKNQATQNEDVLKNIQQLLTKLVERNESRPASQASVRSESCERIIVKSPIPLPRSNQPSVDETKPIYEDIRNFMAENIQEILPSLVSQVQQELESFPIRLESTLADDIRETLMNAEYSDEDYATIHNFPFKKDIETSYDFPNLKKKSSMGFKTTQEEENEYANIQDFLTKAVRHERLTSEFERYKSQNWRIDSSSDEARMTAESTDYYDIVAVNQRIQDLLGRNRTSVQSEVESLSHEPKQEEPSTIPVETPVEEAIYVNTAEIAIMAAAIPTPESSEKKQVKKRRVSRIPVNKNNYLQRRPVKSSSESDFEAVAQIHRSQGPAVHIDHVEELRHVVDNIEKIEHELEMAPDELDIPQFDTDQPIYDNITSTTETTVVEKLSIQQLNATEQQIRADFSHDLKDKVSENNASESQNQEMHGQDYANININDSIASNGKVDVALPELLEAVQAPPSTHAQSNYMQTISRSPTPPKNPCIISPSNSPIQQEFTIASLPISSPPKSPTQKASCAVPPNDQPPPKSPSQIEFVVDSQPYKLPPKSPTQTETLVDPRPTKSLSTSPSQMDSTPVPLSSPPNQNMAVQSPPKSPVMIQVVESSQPNQQNAIDEPSQSLSKTSNNLSDLVLDTKRLIQQMKDEIASDMATMEDEGEAYDDEYYEGDEYEDWSEGDENIEEWDSNEEYDVDENGDFYEYEDEDDDGSVMFSEIAPEDVEHPKTQTNGPPDHVDETINEDSHQLPLMNAALVREIERNSASEVSDLPLDSDFNDALSVIEQSVGEIRDILSLAVGALTENNQLEYDESSSAETMQNSPDTSEISEVTLVADVNDITEPTLVAEENLNLTMKNVQSLLNAKAVIGGFIMNVQKVDSIDSNQVAAEHLSGTSNSVSGANVSAETEELKPTFSTDNNLPTPVAMDVEPNEITPEEGVQPNKEIQQQEAVTVIASGSTSSNETIQTRAENETANATHTLDATIEMLNSVARDLTEQLRQVSPIPNGDTTVQDVTAVVHESNVEIVAQSEIPEYAIVSKNKVTGAMEIDSAIPQNNEMHLLDTEGPEYVNVTEIRALLAEAAVVEQNMVNGSNNGEVIRQISENEAQTEYTTVVKAEEKLETIEVEATTSSGVDLDAKYTTNEANDKSMHVQNDSNSTPAEIAVSSQILNNANVDSKDHYAVTVTTETANAQHSLTNEQISTGSEVMINIVTEQASITASVSVNTKDLPSNELTQIEINSEIQPAIENSLSSIENPQTSATTQHSNEQGDQHVTERIGYPSTNEETGTNEVVLNNQIPITTDAEVSVEIGTQPSSSQLHRNESTFPPVETLADKYESIPTVASDQESAKSTTSADETATENQSTPTESIAMIVSKQSADQNDQTHHLTNGDSLRSSTSREPSEEPSSFIEVQPSEVIIHSPTAEIPSTRSPLPEAPPRSSNIYENIEVAPSSHEGSPKTRKLSLKISTPSPIESNASKKPSPPSTPPTPSGQKTTKIVKIKPKTTTDTKKKTSTTSDPSSRRNSLRKNSIGSPFGPVQTNTVKNMQKEFLSKAQKEPPKLVTNTSKPKPSKLVQPKAFTNKLTKTVTPNQPNVVAGTSKESTPSLEPGSSRSTPGPSSSKGGSRESSVTSEQRRKLRKKYMETCFSDDYITSDEDEDLTTVTESESRTIIRSLVKPFEPSEEPLEVQAQHLLDNGHVQSYQQAELAVQLIEMRYERENAIWAATQCHTIEEAKDLLQKECELCLGIYPMNEIISMLKCTHTCCLDCAKVYFTEEIMHRSITNCNCPYCKEPDLNDASVTEDDVLEYFSNLDILLKNIVDEEVHDLFQRKLRDRTLMQDPNFKWCVDCSSGFFARKGQKRLICPDCGSITCSACRKSWESQHEGISCEKFAAWKEANDPELQAQGVARHLQAHGISCPNCNFKYSLSRGGCMHFTCSQCKFEFCFGCNKPFMMGAKCDVSPYCAKLGLHAHHPRNCLFYLRDKEPRDLQTLLTMHNVTYDTEPSELMKREFMEGQDTIMKCPIPLQKETPAGLMDTICNGDVPEQHAGLCSAHYLEYLTSLVTRNNIDPLTLLSADDLESIVRRANKRMPPRPIGLVDGIYREFLATHYVEYLVGVLSKANIDPLPILDLTDCIQELRRRGMALPERGPWDTDEIYREMCQKIVKEQIPLY